MRHNAISMIIFRFIAMFFLFTFLTNASFAGPATYDPKTRSFRITYTYAYLPHFGMPPGEVERLGTLQEPSKEADAKMRALHQSASEILYDLTDGRARIGSFDHVDNIKQADIIISLTGDFGRAGWAIPGAIEGRPGQVGLYYLTLSSYQARDAALTVAHELMHYLFALPDEYRDGVPALCPATNASPPGPGCLMDNYLARHGFLALCNESDHNHSAPNPQVLVQGHRAQDSCHYWVGEFFKRYATKAGDDETAGNGPNGDSNEFQPRPVSSDLPFSGRFKRVVESTILFVRDQDATKKLLTQRQSVEPTGDQLATVKRMARKYIDQQLKQLDLKSAVGPTNSELTKAIDFIAKQALEFQAERPMQIDREEDKTLREKAASVAANLPRPNGRQNLLAQLFGGVSDIAANPEVKKAIEAVKKDLLPLMIRMAVKGAIGLAPGDSQRLTNEQKAYLDQIAREAVLGSSAPSPFDNYFEAAKLHIELTNAVLENTLDLGSELDLPGTPSRRRSYRDLLTRLEKIAIPGKAFRGFGRRRTILIAPQPLDPKNDFVAIDAGDQIDYQRLRPELVRDFAQLIQRERVLTVEGLTPNLLSQARLGETGDPGVVASVRASNDGGERYAEQVRTINSLVEEIRRNRVENLILFVPPGGIPLNLSDTLEKLRKGVLDDSDVRVDAILFGNGTIPERLRDLVAQSGGTVQTMADVDELGLVAQRLKNEVVAGSWVILPQQGYLDLSTAGRVGSTSKEEEKDNRRNIVTLKDLKTEVIRKSFLQETPFDPTSRSKPHYILNEILSDLDEFISCYQYLKSIYFRDELREAPITNDLRKSYEKLNEISAKLENLRSKFLEIGDNPTKSLQKQLKELDDEIRSLKLDLRSAFWGDQSVVSSALTDTDDYFQWRLRQLLLQEAERGLLAAKMPKDSISKLVKTLYPNNEFLFNDTLDFDAHIYVATLIERTADRDLNIVFLSKELERQVYANRNFHIGLPPVLVHKGSEISSRQATRGEENQPDRLSPAGPDFSTDTWQILRGGSASNALTSSAFDRLIVESKHWESGEVSRNYLAAARLATAASIRLDAMEILARPKILDRSLFNMGGQNPQSIQSTGPMHEDTPRNEQMILQAKLVARNLLRASDQIIDPSKFSELVLRLQVLLEKLPPWEVREQNILNDHIILLRQRSENALSRAGSHDGRIGVSGVWNLAYPDSKAIKANGLTKSLDYLAGSSFHKASSNLRTDINEIFLGRVFRAEALSQLANNQTKQRDLTDSTSPVLLRELGYKDDGQRDLDIDILQRFYLEKSNNSSKANINQILLSSMNANYLPIETLPDFSPLLKSPKSRYIEVNRKLIEKVVEEIEPMLRANAPRFAVERARRLVYGDFPRVILDALSGLTALEDDIRDVIPSLIEVTPSDMPLFKRLGIRREIGKAVTNAVRDETTISVEFNPFQAEADAEFEFVFGISRPLQNFADLKSSPPVLELYESNNLVNTPYLTFEPDFSRETMLVFRVPKPDLKAGKLTPGKYTPKIRIDRRFLPVLGRDNTLNFVFSVATPRPNVQLIAALRQPKLTDDKVEFEKDKEFAFRGTIPAHMSDAIVEVQVLAGASVVDADVRMMFQQINAGEGAIDSPKQRLADDGINPDLQKDDGVYTARITLPPAGRRRSSEYRVYVEAQSTENSRYIDLFEKIPTNDEAKKKNNDLPPPKVPPFQRATSLNFRAVTDN